MMSRVLLFTFSALFVAACGGAVEQPPTGQSVPPVSTLSSSSQDAPLDGTWDLVRLDKSGSLPTEVHDVFQMEVRADGSVSVRRCGKTYYEPASLALRCADAASYDCYYGRLRREGDALRIELPDLLPGESREEGIVDRNRDGIDVRHVVPSAVSGHFIRVDDAQRFGTTSSSTVANCKGS